jgi:hypothetical protein
LLVEDIYGLTVLENAKFGVFAPGSVTDQLSLLVTLSYVAIVDATIGLCCKIDEYARTTEDNNPS